MSKPWLGIWAGTTTVLAATTSMAQATPVGASVAPTATHKGDETARPPNKLDRVTGKWRPKLYGFIEADSILDSTQGFSDVAGNAAIPRPGAYAAERRRVTFGVRNSRFGFKLETPDIGEVKTTALFEMDLLGNQPPTASESAYFTSAAVRIRHAALKIEDPYVNVLAGQYWSLFGWQSYFHPATVEIQGVPGEVFGRTPQIRLSHVFQSEPVDFELAAAALRPAQRNGGVPDIGGGRSTTRRGFSDRRGSDHRSTRAIGNRSHRVRNGGQRCGSSGADREAGQDDNPLGPRRGRLRNDDA